MIILFFGKNKIHPRQFFFFNQFKNLNHNIIYVNNKKNLILRSLFLIKIYFLKFDLIFISWPGFSDIFFIKILALIKKKKIIYDCFTLSYENYSDNFSSNLNLLKKKIYYNLEKTSLSLADLIITDTNQHKIILEKKLQLKNVRVIYINEKKTFIRKNYIKKDKINLIFAGAFRNLHGINNIIKSFKIINLYNKKIYLTLVGNDYDNKYKNLVNKNNVRNIYFFPRLKYQELISKIQEADICLGIFGESEKSQNVITHFLCISSRLNKIIVTKNTDAAREVFKNNGNCYLINNPIVNNLAKKILIIVKNIDLIKKNKNTKLTFENYFNSDKQSEKFKDIILNI